MTRRARGGRCGMSRASGFAAFLFRGRSLGLFGGRFSRCLGCGLGRLLAKASADDARLWRGRRGGLRLAVGRTARPGNQSGILIAAVIRHITLHYLIEQIDLVKIDEERIAS